MTIARTAIARYEDRLASDDVEIKDSVVSKRITTEPCDHEKACVTAFAVQSSFLEVA